MFRAQNAKAWLLKRYYNLPTHDKSVSIRLPKVTSKVDSHVKLSKQLAEFGCEKTIPHDTTIESMSTNLLKLSLSTNGQEEEEWERINDDESQTEKIFDKYSPLSVFNIERAADLEISTKALECSGFPKSFTTQNLQSIFHDYENDRGGFRIKWVDDLTALIIFQNEKTAKTAYLTTLNHPFLQVKLYSGPILEKEIASSSIARPVTTGITLTESIFVFKQFSDIVARRLVAGALGIRTRQKTAEEKDLDRRKIEDAKVKKEQLRLQQQTHEINLEKAWEG
ncbi:hypothetical protein HK096_007298 [Nowakowskiella sp. JEL0078]|nr:hypothetical protein HK096_007298 [Nowakowskiella sp. JEL0078]